MPVRKLRNPDYQPFHCSPEQHLWHQGLALAIYDKAASVTWDSKSRTRRPFSANQTTLAVFFKAHPNSVLNAMNFLRKNGWLLPTDTEGEYKWVSHAEWVKNRVKEGKPSSCIARKLAPPVWQQPEEAA